MKRGLRVFLVVVLLVAAVAGFLIYFVFSDAVSRDRFDQVTQGMTQDRVQQMLGVPDRIRHDTADSTAFFYGGFLRGKWCTMEVHFGADGHVRGKFHDH